MSPSPPFLVTDLMCQAALPEEVAQAGKFLAAAEPVPANPAMSYLDTQGAWVTMPDRSALGEGLDATGYTAEGNAQQRATMASLAKVFQLILRLVKLSDHYLRERDKQATSYFPKPWIVDTIAATRLTEYGKARHESTRTFLLPCSLTTQAERTPAGI